MDSVKPRELATAARAADGLVYVVGVAGVVAGALLFRDGSTALAIVAWALTFVAGVVLRLVAWGARGVAQLLERTERMEADLATIIRDGGSSTDPGGAGGYGRWGRWH